GANLGNGSTTVYYKNGDTSGNLTGTAEDYNAKLETVGGVATLTIKNLSVVGAAADHKYAGIYATTALTINVQGANSVTGADCSGMTYGIYIGGDLTIQGDGALSVTGGTATGTSSRSRGIFCYDLTLADDDIVINAAGGSTESDSYFGSYGIDAVNMNISAGVVNATGGTATGGESRGIYATETVEISGGTVNATGGTAGTSNYSIGIDCGGTLSIGGNATVNATGGSAGDTCGIYSDDVRVTGGVTVATGGTASGTSSGIYHFSSANVTTTTGGVLVARAGSGTTAKAIDGTLNTTGTKIAGQVVGSEFTGSPESYNKNATALAIVPSSYTVQNTKLTDGNTTDYIINTNTAVVTPGTSENGTPLVLTEAGSTVTLNSDLVLINLLGEWVTPAFSFSGVSASPAKVTGSGTLTAIGAAKSDGKSYGISASGNSYLTVDGVDVIAIGGTASKNSYGIGAAANVTVSNGGSVVAIGGAMTNDDADSYGIGSYNLSVSDTGNITAIGGAVRDSAFSYGIDTYKASISDTAEVTAVGGTGGSMSASYGVGSPVTVAAPLTIGGGTLNAIGGKTEGNSYGISNSAGTVDIGKNNAGGTVNAIGSTAASYSAGIYGGTVKTASGTLNAAGGVTNNTGYGIRLDKAMTVSGGSVTAWGADIGIDGQYGQGVTISGGTVTAVGGSVGFISSSSGSLAGGSFTGGEMAVFCQNGVNALLASGCGYFTGDTQLEVADSATTVGSANQTVTVKEAPIPHSHPICGATCTHDTDATTEGVQAAHTAVAWEPIASASELAAMVNGKNYYLANDITVNSTISISGTVNLCLNGKTISAAGGYFDVAGTGTLNLCSCRDNGIIKRTSTTTPANALICADGGATANLYNVTLDGGAVWSGDVDSVLGRGTTNSGISSSTPLIDAGGQYTDGGFVVLTNCELCNNVCSGVDGAGEGGAVTIGPDGVLTATNTKIYNNARTDGQAGAIKAYTGATVTLTGCELYGNSAKSHGGAIQIWGNSGDTDDAKLIMNGGVIRNNKAGGVGGGIAVSDYSQFIMNGGSIVYNATTDSYKRGGGVGFADANTAMSISGNAVISGNVVGVNANNLYIGNNDCNKLSVETMGSNANVGVTMSSPGVFSSGGASYVAQFTSDNVGYMVSANGSDLKLVAASTITYTVTYKSSANSQTLGSVTVTAGEYTLPACTFTPPAGKQFKGWTLELDGEVITTATISVSGNTTLYAIWEDAPHVHNYTYSATDNVITASCTCGHSETATLQLDANASLEYTGSAITPVTVTYSSGWVGERKTNADIVYAGNVNVGTATATLTIDDVSAEITFVITPASVPAVTFPSAVNSITYGQALKDAGLTFTSNAYGTFNWVDPNGVPNAGTGSYAVDFTPNAQAMQNYDWASDSRWIPNRNTLCVDVAVVVNKADQAAPTGLSKTDETISKKADGTISGISSNMEYRKEGEATYEAVNSTVLENLVAGKYYVRYAADNNHNVSSDAEITIGAGRMLTVTVPQNQVGYTMITTTPEVEYFGSIRVEFKLHDGYSMTDSFQICNGTDPVGFSLMGDTYVYGLNFVNSDFNFTVSGVADITAPLAQIDIKNNKWTSFWNGVTFGLFFNETQDVTVTAADTGSGMNSIQYYLAGGELELDEVKQIPVWQDY
ncbi:MAG: hypothetical protein IJN04_00615, partial [Clostridia bacterium]|nr:hypothetical protein [Clostridia bacterium]